MYLFIGDSKTSGGVNTEPVWWDPKYNVVSPRSLILYRDNRVRGDESTVRWLKYDPHSNRAPGYGPVNPDPPYRVGYDNSFMWYMRTHTDKNIGLLKWALGGTTLIASPGADTDWNTKTSEMYHHLVADYANNASGKAKDAGYANCDLKAVFVSLGTNDCLKGIWNNSAFTNSLSEFVLALRLTFDKADLPIYWQQVRSDLSLHPSGNYSVNAVTQCRAAILDYANDDDNFHVLDYESTTLTSDGVHEDEISCEEIGLNIASIFISL